MDSDSTAPLPNPLPRGARGHRGFTLVEAISALAITAMAAAVVLLAMETSLQTSANAVDETIAQGIADQVLDEILGCRYSSNASTIYQYPLGPNAFEMAGNGRERYSDIDDFHGFRARPAEDRFGISLGQGDGAGGMRHPALRIGDDRFANWRIAIDVEYVELDDLSTPLPDGNTSDYRAVNVRVQHVEPGGAVRLLGRARRVVAYIPPPS